MSDPSSFPEEHTVGQPVLPSNGPGPLLELVGVKAAEVDLAMFEQLAAFSLHVSSLDGEGDFSSYAHHKLRYCALGNWPRETLPCPCRS